MISRRNLITRAILVPVSIGFAVFSIYFGHVGLLYFWLIMIAITAYYFGLAREIYLGQQRQLARLRAYAEKDVKLTIKLFNNVTKWRDKISG